MSVAGTSDDGGASVPDAEPGAGRRSRWDAVVLAGGRGSRLGGVDKAALRLRGERLVDRVVAAARSAGATRVIVVGPESAGSAHTIVVREEPPFTGPLAALAAALPDVRAELVLLLSCDLVQPGSVCAALTAQVPEPHLDGAVLRDAEGRPQWLAGLYRTAALRAGIDRLHDATDHAPLRAVLDRQRLSWIDAPPEVTADIDAPADLERARHGGVAAAAPHPRVPAARPARPTTPAVPPSTEESP